MAEPDLELNRIKVGKSRYMIDVAYDDNFGNAGAESDGWTHRTAYVCENDVDDCVRFVNADGTEFSLDGPEGFVELFIEGYASRNPDHAIVSYRNGSLGGEHVSVTPIAYIDYPAAVASDSVWKNL